MKINKQNVNDIKIVLVLVFLLLGVNFGNAQTIKEIQENDFFELNRISFINQIPSKDDEVNFKKGNWFKRILFGNDETIKLQKPVIAVPLTSNQTIIVDQGNATLFINQDNKLVKPKPFKKEEQIFSTLIGGCLLPDGKFLFTEQL